MWNENEIIKESIMFLKEAPYRERKQYIKDYHGRGVEINGFTIQMDVWCWIIWKPTDFSKNPEYNGEPLCKVVPRFTELDKIGDVLDTQAWTYI